MCGSAKAQKPRQAQRAGHKRLAGPHEGEKLQHIEQHDGRARAEPSRDKGGMGDQDLAAFEQRACVAHIDAFVLIADATINCRARWSRNQCDQIIKGNGHRRGIMEWAPSKA